MWCRESIVWAAGLFEGEGCITTKKRGPHHRRGWRLVLVTTDLDVLVRFQAYVGCGNIRPTRRKHTRAAGNKDQWAWEIGGRGQVYALLAAFYPFLGERRRERALEAMKELTPLNRRHTRDYAAEKARRVAA